MKLVELAKATTHAPFLRERGEERGERGEGRGEMGEGREDKEVKREKVSITWSNELFTLMERKSKGERICFVHGPSRSVYRRPR